VLVVNDAFELRGLMTVKDILKADTHPESSKDSVGKLRVGAAIGTSGDSHERLRRPAPRDPAHPRPERAGS